MRRRGRRRRRRRRRRTRRRGRVSCFRQISPTEDVFSPGRITYSKGPKIENLQDLPPGMNLPARLKMSSEPLSNPSALVREELRGASHMEQASFCEIPRFSAENLRCSNAGEARISKSQ